MTLAQGSKLGPYEIQAPLGAGGMGEVYRAHDTRLGRDVALKILPESFTRDADRLHRFEQEARAIAALNHPNVLAVFDIGATNGTPFLVAELLEGETLRMLVDRGALSQRKAIDYGVQIAHGLAAAHEKGIVHRDLKPENIFVTKDAHIKILDFGLAKLVQKGAARADGATLTSAQTAAGVVMGTASYMAPEQVRGEVADARTDIFALGAVLYEMLSGKRAFHRDTPAETMTAALKEDPPEISDSAHPVSPSLDRIVRRCLEKNPEQRFQSAKDLSFALSALSGSDSTVAAPMVAIPRKVSVTRWSAIAVALAVVAGAAWFLARRPVAHARMQFAIPVVGEVSHMALSADGSMLAFVSTDESSGLPMLYVQRIGSTEATLLSGTEGASYPFWSPDAASVAFFANGKLQKIAISGGARQVLATVLAARGGSWGRRNVIIYSPDAGSAIWRINADGTGEAPVTDAMMARNADANKQDETHRWATFLPDGNHFLFWAGNFGNTNDDRSSGIYASSLDGKEKRLVVLCRSSFGYDSGHLYYADTERQLARIAFDPSAATVSGSADLIANAVGFQPSTFWTALTVAENGTLVYSDTTGGSLSALTWVDRSGKELGRLGEPGVMDNPTISPDGSRVAVDISDLKANNVDVWLESATGARNARFTFDPAEEVVGVWSRDGSLVAYRATLAVGTGLNVKRSTGLEQEKRLLQVRGTENVFPNSWSLDDRQILCTVSTATGSRLELVPAGGGSPTVFLSNKGSVTNGMISPDGKWVAYASDDSGNWEVYVTTFPGAAGKWQVSRGGTEPRWRADGKEIFYISPTGMLMAVPVEAADGFSSEAPTPLFQTHGRASISSSDLFTYDATRDGQRFLVNRYVKPDHIPPLNIVLNASADQTR